MREDLKSTLIYKPPGAGYLNLANNENFNLVWHGILGSKIDEIITSLPFHQYGSSSHEQLIASYANYLGFAQEQVMPAPGSDSLIPLLINALTEDTVLTFDTDFFRYGQFAKILGRRHVKTPIANSVDGLIKAAVEHNAELIMFSNPNNPLSIIHKREALVTLLENTDCYVVIDEAYAEYSGQSVTDLMANYPKLLIMRTLSKAWGLARLRVGFLLADPALIQYISAIRGPFALSDLNAAIAAAALAYKDLMLSSVRETIEERTDFINFLQAYSLSVLPSSSNFVYLEVIDAKTIAAKVLEDGIAIAAFGETGLRIAIGAKEQMALLKNSLAKYLPSTN